MRISGGGQLSHVCNMHVCTQAKFIVLATTSDNIVFSLLSHLNTSSSLSLPKGQSNGLMQQYFRSRMILYCKIHAAFFLFGRNTRKAVNFSEINFSTNVNLKLPPLLSPLISCHFRWCVVSCCKGWQPKTSFRPVAAWPQRQHDMQGVSVSCEFVLVNFEPLPFATCRLLSPCLCSFRNYVRS